MSEIHYYLDCVGDQVVDLDQMNEELDLEYNAARAAAQDAQLIQLEVSEHEDINTTVAIDSYQDEDTFATQDILTRQGVIQAPTPTQNLDTAEEDHTVASIDSIQNHSE